MNDVYNPEQGAEEPIAQGQEQEAQPTPEQVTAESSTASEEQHEQNQNGVQKRINELTAKRYAAERERDELKKQLEAAQGKSDSSSIPQPREQTPQTVTPPSLPEDMYDEDAMRQYHTDMVQYNQQVAQQAGKNAFEQQQQAIRQQEAQQNQQRIIETYASNAVNDGVSIDKLQAAEVSLTQAGINPELGMYIMKDKNGGKIAEYLHDNPALMHEVLALDPVSAGIKIATEIKPAALSTTPKVSGAPDPVPSFKGGGAEPKDDFESKNPGTTFM